MNPSVLFPFIIVALLALAAYLIYRTPLDLQIEIERTGTRSVLMLSARWSALTLKSTYSGGERSVSLFFLGKKMVRKEGFKKPEVGKRPERISGADIGLDRVVQSLPPGSEILRFLRAVSRHLTIRRIEGAFSLGLRNPAETGVLFGCFTAIRPFLIPSDRISLSMHPVFDREILEGHVMANVRISEPLFIPALMLRLAMTPGARRLIRRVSSRKAGIAG